MRKRDLVVAVLLGAVGYGVFWPPACIGLVVVLTPLVKVGLRGADTLAGGQSHGRGEADHAHP
jgi:hypothetical protein